MEKQTKNQINRAFVEKELRFYNTADIRYTLVLTATWSLIFLPITCLWIWYALTHIDNTFLKIAMFPVGIAVFSCPIWLNVLALIRCFAERKKLAKGEFEVTVRKVTYKEEKMVHRHVEEFLSFEGFSDISVPRTTYELSTFGDEFYLVHYKEKKTIKLFFPRKMYEYHEV